MTAPEPSSPAAVMVKADVVVVGCGAAGLATAVTAAHETTALRFVPGATICDSYGDLPGAGAGHRSVAPAPVSGRALGRDVMTLLSNECAETSFLGMGIMSGPDLSASLGAVGASTVALVSDLGKPSRFLNMMRTFKLTSPMSVGTWILSEYAGFTTAAAGCDVIERCLDPNRHTVLGRWAPVLGKVSGLGAGAFAAPLAAYTAVLLSNTATPTWHAASQELPFIFVGSALSAAGGAAMVTTPVQETGPARSIAVGGSVLELAAQMVLQRRIGVAGEPLHQGSARLMGRASRVCTVAGVALTLLGRRSRPVAAVAGSALNVGSVLTRFAIFHAGIESAKDPRYTVVPQQERMAARRGGPGGPI